MNSRNRAIALRKKMQLEEKIAQMLQISYSRVSKKEALVFAKLGAGSFLHVLGDDAREIQEEALKSRLGIPVIFGIDAIHGHALNRKSTVFPSPLAMAATFDIDLIKEVARATAKEVSENSLHWTFSPLLCIGRDLRWGRINETFGEDPFLVGEMGKAMVEGYQNDNDLSHDEAILSCAKHFIGYGESTGGRDSYNSPVPLHQLYSVFLPPFKKVIDAGVSSVMAGYQSFDSIPCSASSFLLRDLLQKQLGFEKFVVTDWENVRSMIGKQYVAKDIYEASYRAIKAGNHMIMNTPEFYNATLDLVKHGLIEESLIDESVDKILEAKFELGLFDNKNKIQTLSNKKEEIYKYIGSKEHDELNLRVAEKSIVLLKNDGILPLGKNDKLPKRISLIGPHGDDIMNMLGDWTYFTHPDPCPTAIPEHTVVTLKDALQEMAEQHGFDLYFEKYCDINTIVPPNMKNVIKSAQSSDLVILALGDGVYNTGEEKDRADLSLPHAQRAIMDALIEVGTPIVTVLISSKPLDIYDINKFSSAVIYGFNWGSLGAKACAKILFGDTNPSGKLPISFPRHTGQLPVYYNQLPGWHGGKYIDFHQSSLYTFGHGLSYSDIDYYDMNVELNYEPKKISANPIESMKNIIEGQYWETDMASLKAKTFTVSVMVKNQSNIDCEDVVMLFALDMISSVVTPTIELKAFKRIHLAPYEECKIVFDMDLSMFTMVNEELVTGFESGTFKLKIKDLRKIIDL